MAKQMIMERLARPITVQHPTMSGTMNDFSVVIESIFLLTDEGESPRLAFRGQATAGTWSGFKTFFADACRNLVDGETGFPIQDVAGWLQGLNSKPTPIKLKSLIDQLVPVIKKELGVSIAKCSVTFSSDRTEATFTDIKDTVVDPDDDAPLVPFQWLMFVITEKQLTTIDDVVSDSDIELTIYGDADDLRSAFYREDGPFDAMSVNCIPCDGGRIDIKVLPRTRQSNLRRR